MVHKVLTSTELSPILNSKNPAITICYFGNVKTCPPCRAAHPVFEHLGDKYGKKCNFVDIDLGNSQLGGSYSIRSMPTFIYFHNGVEVKRVTGASSLESDVAAFIEKYGKSIFETSQGKTLSDQSSSTTTTASSSTTKRQPNTNNPWAQKGFNPNQQMKQNAGITEDTKTDDTNTEREVVCDGDSCHVVTKPKATITTSKQEEAPK